MDKKRGYIIGIFLGIIVGLASATLYYQNKIQLLKFGFESESESVESGFLSQIENIRKKLISSQYDYEEIFAERNELKDDFEKLRGDYAELSQKYDELMDDYSLVLGEIPLVPDRASTELIRKEFSWSYLGKNWELSIAIPESIYEFYETHERIPTEDYSVYITHPFDDDYLRAIVEKMNVIAIQEDLTEIEKVNLLITFVQSLPYTHDNVSTPFDEYPRFPIETLIYGGGDCEDTSILTAALLYGLNYDVVLINPPRHMAVGVNIDAYGNYWFFEGKNYFYLETTGEGYEIGECPEEYQVSVNIYGLSPMPVISHTWEASWDNRGLDISVNVKNLGTTIAENYKVWVAFDAGNDLVLNPVESDPFDLQFGRDITIDLTLDVPRNERTRLIVEIFNDDGYYISQSFSEWFNT